jgi:hypothetical protein
MRPDRRHRTHCAKYHTDDGVRTTSTAKFGFGRLRCRKGSPTEAAGIRVQDILLSLDGTPINTVAQYAITFYTKGLGDRVELQMLRDSKRFAASALVQDRIDDAGDLFDQFDVGGVVRALGIMGTTLNEKNRLEAQAMRSRSGVLVWGGN